MNWLTEAFLEPSMLQTIVIISSVASIGIFLGHRKIFGISLGITFVFFVGIIVGHLGINVNKELIGFAQNFGLILFVYSLGLQVGPGFFSSFKKGGIALNIMALGVVAIGLILTIALHFITGISFPNMIGIMTGAVTNTPALGAAQQALLQINPDDYKGVADMALACAVTYPLGVVGVILAVIVLKSIFKRKKVDQEITDKKAFAPFIAEYQVCNPAVYEKTIKSIMKLTQKKFVISRIWRNGKVEIPTSETILTEGDRLLVISKKEDSESIILLFGKQENVDWNNEDIDWNAIDSHLISRRIIITNDKINGVKLGSLNLRNTYGINITRINRARSEEHKV